MYTYTIQKADGTKEIVSQLIATARVMNYVRDTGSNSCLTEARAIVSKLEELAGLPISERIYNGFYAWELVDTAEGTKTATEEVRFVLTVEEACQHERVEAIDTLKPNWYEGACFDCGAAMQGNEKDGYIVTA